MVVIARRLVIFNLLLSASLILLLELMYNIIYFLEVVSLLVSVFGVDWANGYACVMNHL